MVKRINVREGQITLKFPEDIPALYIMEKKILNMIEDANSIITKSNERDVDSKLRKDMAEAFEEFWGKGTCKKVFGTELPCYLAHVEFSQKISKLITKWAKE